MHSHITVYVTIHNHIFTSFFFNYAAKNRHFTFCFAILDVDFKAGVSTLLLKGAKFDFVKMTKRQQL